MSPRDDSVRLADMLAAAREARMFEAFADNHWRIARVVPVTYSEARPPDITKPKSAA